MSKIKFFVVGSVYLALFSFLSVRRCFCASEHVQFEKLIDA